MLFDRRLGWGAIASVAVAGALLGAVALFGAHPTALLGSIFRIGVLDIQDTFLTGLKNAFERASLGLGTGYSTVSARYALVGQVDARYISEAWWTKVILELGIAGLATVSILFGQLLGYAYRAHRRIADPAEHLVNPTVAL